MPLGIRRRKCPVLPLRSKIVRRRSHAAPRDKEVPVPPKIGAETIGGQRQVVIEAHGKPARYGFGLGLRELEIQLPLQILVKQYAPFVFAPEARSGFRIRITELFRPILPRPHLRMLRVQPFVERSREWLRQSQNADGSWGFYGQATAEETAYGLLALSATRFDERDRMRCAAAARYLSQHDREDFPPLWIDKCLYTPPLIVRAAIAGALAAWNRIAERN